jgi:hypothetical protein
MNQIICRIFFLVCCAPADDSIWASFTACSADKSMVSYMRDILVYVDSVFNSLLIDSPCFIISAAVSSAMIAQLLKASKFGNRQVSNSGVLVLPSPFIHRRSAPWWFWRFPLPTRFFHSSCRILHTIYFFSDAK